MSAVGVGVGGAVIAGDEQSFSQPLSPMRYDMPGVLLLFLVSWSSVRTGTVIFTCLSPVGVTMPDT